MSASDFLTRAGHLALWSFRERDWDAEAAAALLWEALRSNGATRFLHARLVENQLLELVEDPTHAEYWLIDHSTLPAIALPIPSTGGTFRRLAPLIVGEGAPRDDLKLCPAELEAIDAASFRLLRPGSIETNPLHRVAEAFKQHCRHAGPRLAHVVAFTRLLQERCGPNSNCLEIGAEETASAEIFSARFENTLGQFWLARAGTYHFLLPVPRRDGSFARWLEAFGPAPGQAQIIAHLAPLAVEPLPEPDGAETSLRAQRFAVPQILAPIAPAEPSAAPPPASGDPPADVAATPAAPQRPERSSSSQRRTRPPRPLAAPPAPLIAPPAAPAPPPSPPPAHRPRRVGLLLLGTLVIAGILVWVFAANHPAGQGAARSSLPATSRETPAAALPTDPAAFLAAFFEASAGHSPRSETAFYADSVNYFGKRGASRSFIAADLAEHNAKWPVRELTMLDAPKITPAGAGSLHASVRLRFRAQNDVKRREGEVRDEITLARRGPSWAIVSINSESVSQQVSYFQAATFGPLASQPGAERGGYRGALLSFRLQLHGQQGKRLRIVARLAQETPGPVRGRWRDGRSLAEQIVICNKETMLFDSFDLFIAYNALEPAGPPAAPLLLEIAVLDPASGAELARSPRASLSL